MTYRWVPDRQLDISGSQQIRCYSPQQYRASSGGTEPHTTSAPGRWTSQLHLHQPPGTTAPSRNVLPPRGDGAISRCQGLAWSLFPLPRAASYCCQARAGPSMQADLNPRRAELHTPFQEGAAAGGLGQLSGGDGGEGRKRTAIHGQHCPALGKGQESNLEGDTNGQ